MNADGVLILPNLGAEEGSDWRALSNHPHVRVSARLWSHLFSADSELCSPRSEPVNRATRWKRERCETLWPASLGPAPEAPAFDGIASPGRAVPWLATATLARTSEEIFGRPLHGPQPAVVSEVHDKAFALEQARSGGWLPRELAPWIQVFEAAELASADPDAWRDRIEGLIRSWPEWLQGRFTLKPRFGSSGRGRIGGRFHLDPGTLRGALSRLAARGGAILEPWLERRCDLSACVVVPQPAAGPVLPTLLGSLEMLVSPAGVFRGHCGEVDARGRVYSGHATDEELRASAVWLAERARERGFFGPCGIDAFSYVAAPGPEGERERLRTALELNARATMGLVTLGLVRRALPLVRETIGLAAENRRGFLFTLLARVPDSGSPTEFVAEAIRRAAGDGAVCLSLAREDRDDEPTPFLFFGPDRERLRRAHRQYTGC